MVRRWIASCSGSYGCSFDGTSRMAGDLASKWSIVSRIIPATCWLMMRTAMSVRLVKRWKASSIWPGVVFESTTKKLDVRRASTLPGRRGEGSERQRAM